MDNMLGIKEIDPNVLLGIMLTQCLWTDMDVRTITDAYIQVMADINGEIWLLK